jgi:hypothetical protein
MHWAAMIGLVVCFCLGTAAYGAEPYLRVGALRWGPGSYRAGQWGTLQTDVINPTNEARRLMVVVSFDPHQRVQFATTVWLPPFSKRNVLQPMRLPNDPLASRLSRRSNITTLLIDERTGAELDREDSPLTTEGEGPLAMLLVDAHRRSMLEALARIPPWPGASDGPEDDLTASLRMRVIQPDGVPRYLGGWDGVDCLIVGDGLGALDAVQEEVLRQWLYSGANIWLAFDQLDIDSARHVFGDMFDCEVIGRVPLNQWTIESPDGSQYPMRADVPVDMAQVVADGFETIHMIDGWPASMQLRVGAGKIFITTLSSRGWLDHRGEPTEPLMELGERIYRSQPSTSLFEYVDLEPLLVQADSAPMGDLQDAVLRILMVMTAVVIVSGLWLAQRDRLDRLAIVVITTTVLTAALFIAIGRVRQREMPAAAALVRMARVEPPGHYAIYEGVLAVRAPSATRAAITASNGELVWPDTLGGQPQFCRMLWSGADRWAWYLPKLPPRLAQMASVSHVAPLPSPTRAIVTPTREGWCIHVDAEAFEPLELAAIAGPCGVVPLVVDEGRLVPRFDPDHPFVDHLAAWGNPKDERLILLRSMVDRMNPRQPVLTALAGRDEGGITFDPQLSARRLSYVTIPLDWRAIRRVVVPPAMVDCALDQDVPNVLFVRLPAALSDRTVTRARLQWRAAKPVTYVVLTADSRSQRIDLDAPAGSGIIELNHEMLGAFEQGQLRLTFEMDATPLLKASVCATVVTVESESDHE